MCLSDREAPAPDLSRHRQRPRESDPTVTEPDATKDGARIMPWVVYGRRVAIGPLLWTDINGNLESKWTDVFGEKPDGFGPCEQPEPQLFPVYQSYINPAATPDIACRCRIVSTYSIHLAAAYREVHWMLTL